MPEFRHCEFSTHILTRRMTLWIVRLYFMKFFSTHILTRRMTCPVQISQIFICFSTHILTRRMTRLSILFHPSSRFFNSHPHKEDDLCNNRVVGRCDFSTHILTRRMTNASPSVFVSVIFSTHILTRRMTRSAPHAISAFIFQLTSSQGG